MSDRRNAPKMALNFSTTHRATHDGREHLVVPAVVLVEGVLNDAYVPIDEVSKFYEAWNGVPVPVLHPEVNGVPISCNSPEIIESQTVGRFYNATIDGNKLKGEMWLDIAKCDPSIIAHLEAGGMMEVSTGYLCDAEPASGEFNGVAYKEIHRNIHPDHIALLPGEIGACSIEDGCGVNRTNRRSVVMKINEALDTIRRAIGLRNNCDCEKEKTVTLKQMADKLKANEMLDASEYKKVVDILNGLPPEKMEAVAGLVRAYLESEASVTEEVMEEETEETPQVMEGDEEEGQIQKNSKRAVVDIDKIVAHKVAEHLRRAEVVKRLKANSNNKLTDKQMAAMPIDALEAVEQSIRPVDYSGAGAFAINAENVTPLPLPAGVLTKKKEA